MFVVLEVICFYLIITYNKNQRDIYFNSSNILIGKITEKSNNIYKYSQLREVNDSLLRENASLIENLISIDYITDTIANTDSVYDQYDLIPASVCNNTSHLRNNHITLCGGSRIGIQKDMGVISSHSGIIGIVRNVSENYAHVITLLNSQSHISCAVKNRNCHGSLKWKNMDPLRVTLIDVPKHEKIALGDTIITSGYSTMFPRGILVGKIENFSIPPGSNNFEITVKLFNDISNVKYGYVIHNRFASEQNSLESEVLTDEKQ
jgi:rod shape-determining protein MreC